MIPLITIVAIVLILGGLVAGIYNKLIRLRNMVQEGWSGIDVQLKKRYDLIPNLVESVKGYASHEKELFEQVTTMRSSGINAQTVKEQEKAENMITQTLGRLFAVAENYPDLQANENFLNLQDKLAQVENDIQMARRYYNGTVRENNIMVESFPSNIVAGMFGFLKSEFFELEDDDQRSNPQISFK